MFGIILPVAAFYIFASTFSNDRASLSAISRADSTISGTATAIVVAALLSFSGLMGWIKTTRTQALKITGSYPGFILAYSVVVAILFRFFMSRPS